MYSCVLMIERISQGVVRRAAAGSAGWLLSFDYVSSFIQSLHCSIADIWSILQSSSDQNMPDCLLHRIPLVCLQIDALKQDTEWETIIWWLSPGLILAFEGYWVNSLHIPKCLVACVVCVVWIYTWEYHHYAQNNLRMHVKVQYGINKNDILKITQQNK